MSRRFKSRTMRFGVPLSVAGSLYVERCYGMHGKGYGGCPPRDSDLELVLMNAERTLWTVDGYFPEPHKYLTDAVGLGGEGWKILGWRMTDASMPLDEYDAIDPELAQFDHLPVPNRIREQWLRPSRLGLNGEVSVGRCSSTNAPEACDN